MKKSNLIRYGLTVLTASAALGTTSCATAQPAAGTTTTAPPAAGAAPPAAVDSGGKKPNIDKMAKEGKLFTDYYAEASCTAGRANFIMGELPIRTGMTTVGQAGAAIGIPAEAVTIATILKSMGYATGQFGKNHLGDLNEFLPTVHGFDEFFGYLYHLDAMEDPAHPGYPQELLNVVGPR